MLSRSIKGISAFAVIALLALNVSCARYPPNQNGLSGRRLVVTLTFRKPVNAFYHYFFLINNAGDQNATGPVPVLGPPYGNGFATGSGNGGAGFTDFVQYDNAQPYGFGVYHVIGNPNAGNFVLTGRPITSIQPDPNNPNTANKLQFSIDMSQLVTDANGQPLTDASAALMAARAIRYLQVNVVATDVIPRDATTQVSKMVDSLGDNRTAAAASSWLIIDMSQNRAYTNEDPNVIGSNIWEPSDVDVYGSSNPDPALDITDWSFQVQSQ
jgi:hypothetical protein